MDQRESTIEELSNIRSGLCANIENGKAGNF